VNLFIGKLQSVTPDDLQNLVYNVVLHGVKIVRAVLQMSVESGKVGGFFKTGNHVIERL